MTMTMSMNAGGDVCQRNDGDPRKGPEDAFRHQVMQQDMSIFFDAAAKEAMVNHATRESPAPIRQRWREISCRFRRGGRV
jgi:hypothetical protein